eukprot:1293231-Rhodomonas_salina.1
MAMRVLRCSCAVERRWVRRASEDGERESFGRERGREARSGKAERRGGGEEGSGWLREAYGEE